MASGKIARCTTEPRRGDLSLQADPIGYKDSLNLYGYVGNDPLNRSDPTGLFDPGNMIRLMEEAAKRARVAALGKLQLGMARATAVGMVLNAAVDVGDRNKNTIYRGVTAKQLAGFIKNAGESASNPNAKGDPASHVEFGSGNSPYLSATRSAEVAKRYAAGSGSGGVLVIDARKLPRGYIDAASNIDPHLDPQAHSMALHDQEVLIRGNIPASAVYRIDIPGGGSIDDGVD